MNFSDIFRNVCQINVDQFQIFSCHLCRQILSQISECSPQGEINCGASSEPKIIQNGFLLMHMLEFLDIHDKCRKSGLEAPLWREELERNIVRQFCIMSSFICLRIFHLDEPFEHSIKCFLCIVGRVLNSSKAVPGVGWMGP